VSTTVEQSAGYARYEDVVSVEAIASAIAVLSLSGSRRSRAGSRHVLGLPVVEALASDEGMLAIARRFVGTGATAFRATFFDKSPASNWLVPWHQDTALPLACPVDDPEWGPWSTKGGVLYAHAPAWALERIVALRVSLDDSTSANGPLRVIPGSHTRGVLGDDEIERLARETSAVDCVAAAGGVVAMRPLTVHASSKSVCDQPRRVLHVEYAASLDLGRGVRLALA
jgi:hypothetical protein